MTEKLVRDNIPQIMISQGKTPKTRIAGDEEYKQKLYEKLKEEVKEFIESESKEEFADLHEVINAIGEINNFKDYEVEETRARKADKVGQFKKRIILDITNIK